MIILPDGVIIEMQWKQIKYTNYDKYIIFQIIPMMEGRDLVLIPNKKRWNLIESIFTLEEREEIIFLLEKISWKRDLKIVELDIEPFVNKRISISHGMIEATEGYVQLSNENLFDPTSKLEKNQVKKLYCILEEKYAKGILGEVIVPKETIVKGSVMEKITLPILKNNKNVKLNYVST